LLLGHFDAALAKTAYRFIVRFAGSHCVGQKIQRRTKFFVREYEILFPHRRLGASQGFFALR
jgi:hypothetical protein